MDLLDELAGRLSQEDVPPVPERFDAGVRRKLHPRLLAAHVVEFAFGAMATALWHMTVALVAAMRYTLVGSWPATNGWVAGQPSIPADGDDRGAAAGEPDGRQE
jgi:hypothetical protein